MFRINSILFGILFLNVYFHVYLLFVFVCFFTIERNFASFFSSSNVWGWFFFLCHCIGVMYVEQAHSICVFMSCSTGVVSLRNNQLRKKKKTITTKYITFTWWGNQTPTIFIEPIFFLSFFFFHICAFFTALHFLFLFYFFCVCCEMKWHL